VNRKQGASRDLEQMLADSTNVGRPKSAASAPKDRSDDPEGAALNLANSTDVLGGIR
jgi:hypothetical protein